MADFYEIDFLDVESPKSGDAITVRYSIGQHNYVHVVDGGFQATGDSVVTHLTKHYGSTAVDHVIVTHPDGDHAGGLRTVLEKCAVRNLWMLRPWLYAGVLLNHFEGLTSVTHLTQRLRNLYPNLAALEDIAIARKIPIHAPFQGAQIGAFRVMAPSQNRYLSLILESERTPETKVQASSLLSSIAFAEQLIQKAFNLVKAVWGAEVFSAEETSAENEMSVIQFARIADHNILLTADAGRSALQEAINYAPLAGLVLPGIDKFQVPHHGSRRNVSSALLDSLLGPKIAAQLPDDQSKFTALISSAAADPDHPRKSVERALMHRGGKVVATEGRDIRTSRNAPDREGWVAIPGRGYPQEQEE